MGAQRQYEMMCLLDPTYAEEGSEEKKERIKGILESQGVEVESVEEYGTRKLAYEIDNYQKGYYLLFNFKGTADTIEEISDRSNVEEGLLRYEIVNRADNLEPTKTA